MNTKKGSKVFPVMLFLVLSFSNVAKSQYENDNFKRSVFEAFVNLEDELEIIDEQIVFMYNNEIYDFAKIKQLQKAIEKQRKTYHDVMNEINYNGVYDSDYKSMSDIFVSEINQVIGNLNIYKKQLSDNDKSERGKQLIEALDEIFNGK